MAGILKHPWPYLKDFYEVVDIKKDSFVFKCILCLPSHHTISSFKNSPSNLRKHIERKHSSHLRRYADLTTSARKSKTRNSYTVPCTTLKQESIEDPSLVTQSTIDCSVLNFVVQSLQPFSLVDQPAFQALLRDLQPNSTLMSRTTLQRKIDEASIDMKRQLKETMRTVEFIATTTDAWSVGRRHFLGVTAHWLDPDSLERVSVALACKQLKGSLTFDVLALALNDIHSEYNITHKIFRTTTDNGSNFVKTFNMYGEQDESNNCAEAINKVHDGASDEDEDADVAEVEFLDVEAVLDEDDGLYFQLLKHHRCACHLLNLISTIDATKANSNDSYKKLSQSTFSKCQALWNECGRSSRAVQVKVEYCEMPLFRPNARRWNSLFLAVERILQIIKEQGEGAVRAICASLELSMFSRVELSFLDEYCTVMSPIVQASSILRSNTDVQMGWLLPTLSVIINKLDQIRKSSRYCRPLVDALQDGLQKRFAKILVEPELIAAAILVPKFKTFWTTDENTLKLGLDYIRDYLKEDSSQSPSDASNVFDEEDFFSTIKRTQSQEHARQLDGFLACEVENKEILKFFPALRKLYLRLNTALPASAACERLFGTAGLVFSPQRARLDSLNFENQLLLKLNKKMQL